MTPDPQPTEVRTKSGRLVKQPNRYTPIEKVEDDYLSDEYDDDDDDDCSSISSIRSSSEEEDLDDDSEGSLADFVVPDDEDEDEDED